MPVYGGSNLLWRTRAVRRQLRPPVVWWRHRRLGNDDVILASYPRSGSTWMAFMIADLLLSEDPGFTDAHAAVPELRDITPSVPTLPHGGRVVRSHEPRRPEYARAVYLVRDPRDVAVSYFHYRRWLREFCGDMPSFVRMFVEGTIDSYGTWADHVGSWLNPASDDTLVLRFESVVADPVDELTRVAAFLGLSVENKTLERAVANQSLGAMRTKEAGARERYFRNTDPTGKFVRSGQVGSWREVLSHVDVDLVESHSGRVMTRLGYQLEATQ
jgi:Sulfotransferase domain